MKLRVQRVGARERRFGNFRRGEFPRANARGNLAG
jgi:hypothetical protein